MIDAAELAEFAAIPGPTGAEEERLRWLQKRLAGLPGTRARDEAGNLVWWLGSADEPPALLLMAHVDTVFADLDEIKIVADGGDLTGPGIGDNAAAVMAVVWALERMQRSDAHIAVAFTVGEEGLGNLRGALHACGELRPRLAVAVEGHGLDDVVVEHVGSVRARVAVDGPGGHSWWDREIPSAVHALVPIATALIESGANVGRFAGGEAVNAIAARAEMLIERRSVEQSELDSFESLVHGLTAQSPLSLGLEIVGRRPAGQIDRSHPLVQAIVAARALLGLGERFSSGSTDANAAAALGIPAVSIGCTRGSGMHTTHERIALEPLELGCRQLAGMIEALTTRLG